jgi:hypothetical protein
MHISIILLEIMIDRIRITRTLAFIIIHFLNTEHRIDYEGIGTVYLGSHV